MSSNVMLIVRNAHRVTHTFALSSIRGLVGQGDSRGLAPYRLEGTWAGVQLDTGEIVRIADCTSEQAVLELLRAKTEDLSTDQVVYVELQW